MAVLTGVSVLAGAAPVLFLINADIQATGLGAALVMSTLAGFLVSIAGGAIQHGGGAEGVCLQAAAHSRSLPFEGLCSEQQWGTLSSGNAPGVL